MLFHKGRLFRSDISRADLENLLRNITSTANNARDTGFAELFQGNTICLAFARNDKKHLLKPWAIERKVMDTTEAERDVSDSSFRGPAYPIDEVKRIISKIDKKKRQFNRKALNTLVIRANRLFLPSYMDTYIKILEQEVYARKYLSMLIVIGGHVGGLEINSRMERNGHLYLVKSVDLITKEILIITNKCSMNSVNTLNFSSKIKTAFENCNTLLF